MSVFGVIFWIWLLISLVVLVSRQVKKRRGPQSAVVSGTGPMVAEQTLPTSDGTDDAATSGKSHAAGGSGDEPPPETTQTEDLDAERVDSPNADAGQTADHETSVGDHDPAGDDGPTHGTDGAREIVRAMLAGDLDMPLPSASSAAQPRVDGSTPTVSGAPRARGIAGALEGIKMPCELAPLTIGTDGLDPDHVDLVTSGHAPGAVADDLKAEFERLDYDVTELGDGEYRATRGQTVVGVRVHDRPAVSVSDDGRGFATADPDSIVVELTLA